MRRGRSDGIVDEQDSNLLGGDLAAEAPTTVRTPSISLRSSREARIPAALDICPSLMHDIVDPAFLNGTPPSFCSRLSHFFKLRLSFDWQYPVGN